MADNIETAIVLNAKDNTRGAFARLNKNLQKSKVQTQQFGTSMTNLQGAVLRATAVLATFTVTALAIGSSIGAAKRFGRQMAEVSTLIDDADTSLKAYSETVDNLISTYGGDFQSTTKALYDTISAGNGTVAEATKILTAANVAAIAGVSDIATATDAFTTVLNSYSMSANEAGKVSDILFATVRAGKTTLGEIAPALGKVTPLAAAMNVNFEEVGAALATVTATGLSTSEVVTSLKAIISNIIKPTEDAKGMAEELGFAFNSANLRMKGFGAFFAELIQKSKEAGVAPVAAIEKLFGSVEALNTALGLAAEGGAVFQKNLMAMENSAGSTAVAFEKMTKTFDFQWTALVGKIKVGAKNLGTSFTDFLITPLTFINDHFDEWSFRIKHTFAQVLDATKWLVSGVINAFTDWRGTLNWILDNVIMPIKNGFRDLYMAVVGGSYVPNLVKEVIEWFHEWASLPDWINTFVLTPINVAFRALTFVLSGIMVGINSILGLVSDFQLPDFGAGLRTLTPAIVEVEESLQNILTIFAGGLGLEAIRKFLGIGLFAVAWKLYDRLVGRVQAFSGAMKANRAIAFEAQQANFKRLQDQTKFYKAQNEFAGKFGKTLQKIVDSGGTRNILSRFFGGSDQWVLAKAKAQDAIESAKKAARGLRKTGPGTGEQGILSRILFGKLSQSEIDSRLKAVKDSIKKSSADLAAVDAKRGFFGYLGNASKLLIERFKFAGNAIETVGTKFSTLGNKLRSTGLNLGISAAINAASANTSSLINKIATISPTAAKVATNMKMRFAAATIEMGMGLRRFGETFQIVGAKAQGVLNKVSVHARALQIKFGRGIVHAALFGKATAVGLTKVGVGVLKGVARAAAPLRTGLSAGLMGFLMFGDDIEASLAAAKMTETTGDVFTDFQNQFTAAVDAMPDTSLAMLALLGPVGMLAGAALLIFKHWDKIKEIFFQFIAWAKKQDWGEIILSGLATAGEALGKLGVWLGGMIFDGFMLLGQKLAELGSWIWEQIVDAFTFDDVGTGLLDSLKDIGSKVIELFLEWNPLALWLKGVKKVAEVVSDSVGAPSAATGFEAAAGATGGLVEKIPRFADGGKIRGPGTGTSDSIPALLSDGEYIVNAGSTKKYHPLLEALNNGKDKEVIEAMGALKGFKLKDFLDQLEAQKFSKGGMLSIAKKKRVKYAAGGSVSSGTSLSDLVAGGTSVSGAKQQFIATFGNVDFSDAQQFLNTLIGIKLSKEDLAGMDPLLLKQITSSMNHLALTSKTVIKDMDHWTNENSEMTNALKVSSDETAEWHADLIELLKPLFEVKEGTKELTQALKESAENLSSFGKGWAETISEWRVALADETARGARAATRFTGIVSGVVDTIVEGGNIKDNLKDFLKSSLEETAKATAKDQILKAFAGQFGSRIEGAGEGAGNIFQATGNVLFKATGNVVIQGAEGAAGGLSSLLDSKGSTPGSEIGKAANIFASLGGSFADGGIPPTNQVSLVGEKGPELFIPTSKGRIIPNNQISNMTNSNVSVNQTLNISEAMNPEEFQKHLAKNNQTVVAMVQQAYSRRGKNNGPLG